MPIKNRPTAKLLQAYCQFYHELSKTGQKPKLHKLKSKTLHEVEEFIANQQAQIQYALPDNH